VADRSDIDGERIAVAAPRATRRATNPPAHRPMATEAGLSLIVVLVAAALLGWAVGGTLGAHVAGALVGGLVGLVAGFAATYLRYREL
jgi:hypothetical protein